MVKINKFTTGVIGIVGALVALNLIAISASPGYLDDVLVEPIQKTTSKLDRISELPPVTEIKPVACTLEWAPVCGTDGTTYSNMCNLDAASAEFAYAGECEVIVELKSEPLPEPPTMAAPTPSESLTVSVIEGSGVPGCEETDECYIPSRITIRTGDTVTWSNDDTAAHTVTSGTPSEVDGKFESGLFMARSTFDFTFDEAGTYDYFCMVHPWMTGIVEVS